MVYWATQHLVYELVGPDSPVNDAAAWAAVSLDFLLAAGLFFLVAQALWRSISHR